MTDQLQNLAAAPWPEPEIVSETAHYVCLRAAPITEGQAIEYFEFLYSRGYRYLGGGHTGIITCEKLGA